VGDSKGGSSRTRLAMVAVGGTSHTQQTNSDTSRTFMVPDCSVLSDVNCSVLPLSLSHSL
jgi:hypothetical protein